jgi:hypothetical protein
MQFTVAVALLAAACNQPEYAKQAEMAPDPGETLPEWAFDAPYYFQPTTEAMPRPVTEANSDYPTHYYVNRPIFPIDRPDNEVRLDRAPRVAVWWTNTDGGAWARAGCFGLGQTHFHFVAGDDGVYGVRFVGPGIRESLTQETVPHRIYHVDTVAPCVTVRVAPDQPVYYPEDELAITWTVEDPNLDVDSVRLNVCWSWENPDMLELRRPDNEGEPPRDNPPPPATRLWRPYKPDCRPSDMATFTIPPRAQGEALQLQVRAKDRAGNYAAGYSCPIFVSGVTSWATPQAAAAQPRSACTRRLPRDGCGWDPLCNISRCSHGFGGWLVSHRPRSTESRQIPDLDGRRRIRFGYGVEAGYRVRGVRLKSLRDWGLGLWGTTQNWVRLVVAFFAGGLGSR